MARKIKVGDWINTPAFGYEVEITGEDKGANRWIVRYVRDNGTDAWKTIVKAGVTLYVD